jgi:hypothetical protein
MIKIKKMQASSLFFIIIWAIPLFALLFWLMKQDKKQRKVGYLIVFLILAFALYVILTKSPSYKEVFPNL